MQEDDGTSMRWHLDKRVPISIIATMILQAALGVWFVSKLESRVVALETARAEQRAEQRERDDRQDKAVGESIGLVRSDVREISSKIDRLLERVRQ